MKPCISDTASFFSIPAHKLFRCSAGLVARERETAFYALLKNILLRNIIRTLCAAKIKTKALSGQKLLKVFDHLGGCGLSSIKILIWNQCQYSFMIESVVH